MQYQISVPDTKKYKEGLGPIRKNWGLLGKKILVQVIKRSIQYQISVPDTKKYKEGLGPIRED